MTFLFINVNHEVGYESSESIPISLGYILANLKANGFDGVILDDLRDRPLTLHSLEKWITRTDPKVIAFTTYQSTMERIRFLCRYIKSRHRNINVVLGGPQIPAMPAPALEALEDVDVLVRGEAEQVLTDMALALAANEPLETVSGIACKCGGGIIETGRGPKPPDDLDVYPSPYLTDILNLEGKDTAILLTSRGCRHVCRFCITPRICRGKIRFHSVERVIAEMELLASKGIERFWFADPNFTGNRERTERLLEEKIRRGIKTPFWCQTRADLVDPPLLAKLKAAGADTVAFGLESGSPGVLEKTNKKILLEQLKANVEAIQHLEMETELFSIFGLPGETVEDARRTLEFVRSLGIQIQSNSGSQQMQLYFGSLYERNPSKYGIKPLDGYRPPFVSVGDRFETTAMTHEEMRKVRNMWALANTQLERDVYYKQRLFEILDFFLENRRDLEDEPAFYAYGALAAGAIEEFDLLRMFVEGFASLPSDGGMSVEDLISSLSFFQETAEPAGPTDRIIFDSRSWIDGVPFTGISGKYWDVLLSRGLLLDTFEKGLVGARAGGEVKFAFVFPDDYFQEELQGREVEVQAKIHKVFRSPEVRSLEELRHLSVRNRYDFQDLDLLSEENEILYYLTLRDTDPAVLLKTPGHFLKMVHYAAKLGKRELVEELAALPEATFAARTALADTLARSGKCAWALEYYESIVRQAPSAAPRMVRCLLGTDRASDALALLESAPESSDIEFQETLLQCLKTARPDSERIPSLEHHTMDLRIEAALAREYHARTSHTASTPVVHGYSNDKELFNT